MNDLTMYNAVKDQMKTGDPIQWNSSSLLGSTIRMATRKRRRPLEIDLGIDVNHTSGVLRIPLYEGAEERRYLPESLENGPSLNLLSNRLEEFDGEAWWYPIVASPEERIKWGENALDCIGCSIKYGYDDVLGFWWEQPDINPANGLFCSEFWMYCWGDRGRSMSPNELTNHRLFKNVMPVRIL